MTKMLNGSFAKKLNCDGFGSLTAMVHIVDCRQVSINIINLSDTEVFVTVMTCNEVWDSNRQDNFIDEV